MFSLRMSVPGEDATEIVAALVQTGGVVRLVTTPAFGGDGGVVISADVNTDSADRVVEVIEARSIAPDAYLLSRLDIIAPSERGQLVSAQGVAWVEILGQARANSRPLARYLALIIAAGVIAALGVITANTILIVGAMAVSPDLLPICAVCVGLMGRRPRLAWRALVTLLVGLVAVTVVAALITWCLNVTNILPSNFAIGQGGLGGLAHTDYSTVLVALAAGTAAMLSFETRAGAAVGVAISVTTIPASAYLGVALGAGQPGAGALLVLLVNVTLLITSGTLTLMIQRRAAR